ncbi:uncharacterized protein RHOBADRAFT_53169 [Rhodotorula graminis WP1]|uniref:Proteophosphoglycan ppg4 n=1 Tax=Rhodotorula graminis (strain WP1) TaxID=578459 RepID=A0A194S6W2_RHOGW|nr:uncharacterized protein RHOBADRAFT_53169 [Rhodotorula graminis WP1]KPV75151.1 hypothetical protein RHOBADRAFT_53169 [Rhodotorula graminis WP1]
MAAPLERVYRPRALTRRELDLDHDKARAAQERTVKRAKKEAAQHEDRSSTFHHSGIAGIAFKDFQLGRGVASNSRALLDEQAYAARRRTVENKLLDDVPRLSSVCLEVLVDNYGERGVFDALDPVVHREYAAPLLATLARRIGHGTLPFQVWLDFAHRFALELPPQRRTYRGLCVGDGKELGLVKELNAEAVERWAHETAYPSPGREPLVPPFYLAYLDLRGDTTFTDGDIYKLRNPLSHFLAVLRLDGTSISDEALTWIARAARDPPQYAQLQVLSLRGLLKVTDAGVLQLSSLANLRSLDLRGTQCTSAIRAALNRSFLGGAPPSTSSSTPLAPRFWRPARPRPDLPTSLPSTLEPQLFEPANFSPARTLALLHYLARVESTPAGPQRRDVLRTRALVKPLGLHLTAVTRSSCSSATVSPASSRPDATADELYRDQLALSYGAKRAAYHAGLGSITSTVPLSRGLVEEEGRRESDKGAAFRNRNDAVAAGEWIGAGARTGGRAMLPGQSASLYDVGTRKVSREDKERGAREPFSDSEGDDEREQELEAEEAAERKRWEDESAQRSRFYRPLEPPTPRGPRTWAEPLPSDLMLVRHVPYVAPWEGSPARPAAAAADSSEAHDLPRATPGGTLKKRKRPSFPLDSPSPPPPSRTPSRAPPPPSSSSSSPAVATPSSSLVKKRQPASATPSSSSTSTSTSTSTSRTPAPALYTARSASKNIVRTTPALPKRSALSAFRTKKKT